ncbi:hypothetical protein JCM11641_002723 [Rhodosporidiobolus odoratus]
MVMAIHVSKEDFRLKLLNEFSDVISDAPATSLPPLRNVVHNIPLIDPTLKIEPVFYKVADVLRPALDHQTKKNLDSGAWEQIGGCDDASPGRALPKKDNEVRVVVDARQRNMNTVPDYYPLPPQGPILSDVSRSEHCTVLDAKESYHFI